MGSSLHGFSTLSFPRTPSSCSLKSSSGSFSSSNSSSENPEEPELNGKGAPKLPRKTKHRFVETNRREKKQDLTKELMSLLGGKNIRISASGNPSINQVLETTLDFLKDERNILLRQRHSHIKSLALQKSSELVCNQGASKDCKSLSSLSWIDVPRNFTSGSFGAAFDFAPMAMVMATPQGNVIRCNNLAFNLFGVNNAVAPTMLGVTAEESREMTRQVIAKLLCGEAKKIKLVKRCGIKDGSSPEFQTEMNCIHKNGKPQYFVCYLRLLEGSNSAGKLGNRAVRTETQAAPQCYSGANQKIHEITDEVARGPVLHKSSYSTLVRASPCSSESIGNDTPPAWDDEEAQFRSNMRYACDLQEQPLPPQNQATSRETAIINNWTRYVTLPLTNIRVPIEEEDLEECGIDQILRQIEEYKVKRDRENMMHKEAWMFQNTSAGSFSSSDIKL